MIAPPYLAVLQKLYARLKDGSFDWVITGSVGMALQGMEIEPHDIDLQTDKAGAYEIARLFAESVRQPIHYRASERVRSYYGLLEMDGIQVEVMGDLQKRITENVWEEPVRVARYRCWVEWAGMRLPVLDLEYEYQAYLKLGRKEKAEQIRRFLEEQPGPHEPGE